MMEDRTITVAEARPPGERSSYGSGRGSYGGGRGGYGGGRRR
jgi:hypothetical protein